MKKLNRILSLLTALVMLTMILVSCGGEVAETMAPTAENTVAPVDPAQTTVAEPTEYVYKFIGCGDSLIHPNIYTDAANRAGAGDEGYNYLPVFENVKGTIESADIAFINQETVMANGYELSGYPMFNSPQKMGKDLVTVGFNVVNIATNHMLDKFGDGLQSTIEFWKSQPVLMVGGYENEADFREMRIMNLDGVSIAWLSFTYGTNGMVLGDEYSIYIPYLNDEDIQSQIAAAKEQADMVFVSVHWGTENMFTPNEEQIHYAQLMADCGADAIIGHHPHVIQPIEWLTGKDGNQCLCVYSLGNLISGMAEDYNMVGGFITFDVVAKGDDFSVQNPIFIPTVYHYGPSYYNGCLYYLSDYSDALASQHGIMCYGNTTTLATLKGYVTNTIASEFLPEEYRTAEETSAA